MNIEVKDLKITPAAISGVVELTSQLSEQSIEFAKQLNDKATELNNNPELVEQVEKETKKELAAVNKTVKAIKDKVKEINDTLIPAEFVELQKVTKEAEKVINDAKNNLKAPIDQAKIKRLERRKEELIEHFEMAIPANIESKLTFEMLDIKITDTETNSTSKMKKITEKIDSELARISETVDLISSQQNGELLVKYYFDSNLDIATAKNKLQNFLEAQKIADQPKVAEQPQQVVQVVKEVETPTVINNGYNVQENVIMTIKFDRSLTHRIEQLLANEDVQILGKEIE